MTTEKLHPDAARVCEMIVAANRPPLETLTPPEAREAYLAARQALAAGRRRGRRGRRPRGGRPGRRQSP